MDLLDRPIAPDPYESLPPVPTFTLTSTDFQHGEALATEHTAQGGSASPQLSWAGFPPETESFLLTCFDPDAPTPSGYWHWVIQDIPETITALATGAGTSDLELAGPMFHSLNDAGTAAYFGAAPPAGDRPHRYIFAVAALDVPTLELADDAMPATVAFTALFHTLARATLTGVFQEPTVE